MIQPLHVALIQSDIHWENAGANLAMFEEKIWQLEKPVDVIVLPEMFSTGFTMNAPSQAEVMGLTTFRWMKQMAEQSRALVLGSFIATEKNKYFNRLLWMEPSGNFKMYDKRHLFRLGNEDKTFTAGTERLVSVWKGWKLLPIVCYDLRFPVWCRNRYDPLGQSFEYDALVVVANWPQPRIEAWKILLKARAIENLSYALGVNRVGDDGTGIHYPGRSMAVGPKGEMLRTADNKETSVVVTLDPAYLQDFRTKFPVQLDADDFKIHL